MDAQEKLAFDTAAQIAKTGDIQQAGAAFDQLYARGRQQHPISSLAGVVAVAELVEQGSLVLAQAVADSLDAPAPRHKTPQEALGLLATKPLSDLVSSSMVPFNRNLARLGHSAASTPLVPLHEQAAFHTAYGGVLGMFVCIKTLAVTIQKRGNITPDQLATFEIQAYYETAYRQAEQGNSGVALARIILRAMRDSIALEANPSRIATWRIRLKDVTRWTTGNDPLHIVDVDTLVAARTPDTQGDAAAATAALLKRL